jgi:thioredoxin
MGMHQKRLLTILASFALICPMQSCSSNTQTQTTENTPVQKSAKKNAGSIVTITSEEQFKKIIESSGDRLLVFDLYADWCMPCKIVAPILEKIAKANPDKASFYKVNVDDHQRIAAMFGVTGIPFVVFVKNQKGVHALTGVRPEAEYQRAVNEYASVAQPQPLKDTPDGEIINGTRVIHLTTATDLGNIYVYRGDNVQLVISKIEFPYSIHIPEYDISREGVVGQDITVEFSAKNIGVFPIFCNGKCPSGDGARFGQIIVLQYKPSGDTQFKELTSDEAKAFIGKSNPLILDVRTPNEYHAGHIAGAKLIPVQQLGERLKEIESYKDKDILIYCRSGNRSTVASQILNKNGFKRLYNLRYGYTDWEKKGFPVVKESR